MPSFIQGSRGKKRIRTWPIIFMIILILINASIITRLIIKVLSEKWRKIHYQESGQAASHCDSSLQPGWYRCVWIVQVQDGTGLVQKGFQLVSSFCKSCLATVYRSLLYQDYMNRNFHSSFKRFSFLQKYLKNTLHWNHTQNS